MSTIFLTEKKVSNSFHWHGVLFNVVRVELVGLARFQNGRLIGYIKINKYIFHKQVYFACIEPFQVFLSFAKSIVIVNTCYSIVRLQKRSPSKMRNSSSCFLLTFLLSFLLSCQKLYSTITTLYDKLLGRFYNKHTVLASVHGLDRSRIVGTATDSEVVGDGQPPSLPHAIFNG